ncbi:TPA: hypothetical protein N0F65_002460, partial [Lagenidium giganteum]
CVELTCCASHRFNLAIENYLVKFEPILAKIANRMRHLSTLQFRVAMKKVTPLQPMLRNEARWSSTFAMVERWSCLHEDLQRAGPWHFAEVNYSIMS